MRLIDVLIFTSLFVPQFAFGCKYPPTHSWEWSPEKLVWNSKDILVVQVFSKEDLGRRKFLYKARVGTVLKGKLKKDEVVTITLDATAEPLDKTETFYLYKSTECETFGNLLINKQYIYAPNVEHPEAIRPVGSVKSREVQDILTIIKKTGN